MSKNRFPALSSNLNWGAIQIAGLYLLIGCLWILFSDRIAAKVAPSEEMLTAISLYKGWTYVIVTAVLLYWLIRRRTAALYASEAQLLRVINSFPALISYIDADRRYQFTNKAYQEWFGNTVQGKHMQEALGSRAYQTISKHVDQVLAGETVSYETEIPYANGERFVNATYVPDIGVHGEIKGFFVLVHDMTDQKEAEEELQLWADAFEGCAHGIAIGDPDTNRVVVCNPAFASLHKARVEEIVGSAILSLYAPADHEHVRRQIQKADQIGHVRFEANMILKDETTFPVQMDVVSVLGENGQLLYRVATAQDISERRAMDEKLKESETKYRTLVEHLPAITYIAGPDQYIGASYISPQIESLGFRRDTWLADPEFWFRQILPEDQEWVQSELERFRTSGESFRAEYRLRLPNGEVRWFHDEAVRVKDQQGRPILIQGFMLDITDRKQAEKQLLYQAALLENVNDAIVASDAEYRITVWNSAAESLYGWKAEEVVGRNGLEILRTEWPQKEAEEMRRTIARIGRWRGEATQARKDGSRFPVEVSSIVLYEEDKQITAYVSVNRDITERKQAEEERKSLARFPAENPNPILRVDHEGKIIYANAASKPLLDDWHARVGEQVPDDWNQIIGELIHTGSKKTIDVPCGMTIYSIIVVPVSDTNDVNLYGRDITELKQAEEKLRRFELLSEHSRDIILFMERKDGHILEANAAAQRAYGYSRDELLALTIHDLRAADTQDLAADQMAQADTSGILFETVHRRKDGSTFPVEISSQGATIRGERTLISVVRDISERKQAEAAIQLKDELLHMTSEMAKVGGWEFDPETGNGTWTDEVARIHDLDPAQETNVELGVSFYMAESRQKIEQAIKEAIEAAKPYDLELEMVSAKGNHKWIRTMGLPSVREGKVTKVQGIFQDITERKRAEEALQRAHDELEQKVQERTAALSQANSLLQALMDHMPDHIYFKDTQSRFIRNSRSQALSLGLRDPAETIGKTDFDFFPHAAKAYAEEQEVMRSGKPLVDFEEWVVWPDGKETWVSTTKVPLRNSDGETIGIFGISRDITERKKAEQYIRQLNADLEKQAAQLQAANKELEAFSYSVSHDLRAPLRAIDGYTRILVEDYEAKFDEEGKRICGIISAEARRMGQLIDDLLSFSRLGRKQMYTSRIDMRSMVESAFEELIKEEDRERIDLRIGKLPPVKGDSSLIRQVWVNLLSNAIKFSSKKERAVIEVGSKQTPEENIYFVRDNGAGFDMEYANKLFGVFQRLHGESEFEGTGVGLAIVQRIIRRHGGQVWAEGEVDRGATFYFALPRKEISL